MHLSLSLYIYIYIHMLYYATYTYYRFYTLSENPDLERMKAGLAHNLDEEFTRLAETRQVQHSLNYIMIY